MFELINNPYLDQEIATIVVLFLYFILRVSSKKLVRKYATLNEVLEHRSNLVIKYIYLLLGILAFISIVIIWGVKKRSNISIYFLSFCRCWSCFVCSMVDFK